MSYGDSVTKHDEVGGAQAAAILLMLLDEAEAASILQQLEPDEIQLLGSKMFEVANVSEDQVETVLDIFVERARERTTVGMDADRRIRAMMERAIGHERAENVLTRITPSTRSTSLDALKWMDPRAIATMIETEHPQIGALLLASLEPPIAAEVLQMVDDSLQADLIFRVATLGTITSEAIEELEQLVLRQSSKASSGAASKRGGAAEAAQIVNNARTSAEQRIIRALGKLDKTVARTVEDEMFTFDNLLELDDRSLGTLVRSLDGELLVAALKGSNTKLRDRVLACMSSRAAQSLMDTLEERGPMRVTDVHNAQKKILNTARRLAAEGAITLDGKGEDYV
jgi:flagellar motor switch protein FliG